LEEYFRVNIFLVYMGRYFRMPMWLRRMVRRRVSEIPVDKALDLKSKTSLAYAFIAWNLFGLIGYKVYKGEIGVAEGPHDHLSQARQFAKLLKMENSVLVRVEGLTPVGTYDLREEFKNNESNSTENKEDPEELKC